MKKLKLLLIVCFLCCNHVYAQMVQEKEVPGLPDIAIATLTPQGKPIVYLNPQRCKEVGTMATLFFKMHEQGHHALGHVMNANNKNPYVQLWLNATAETAADIFATNYWIKNNWKDITGKEIITEWCGMMWELNLPGDKTHPASRIRVENVVKYFYNLTGDKIQYDN